MEEFRAQEALLVLSDSERPTQPNLAIETGLAALFASPNGSSKISCGRYRDSEVQHIAKLLKYINPEWARIPRIYIVMRAIGCLDLLGHFVDQKITDICFPFTVATLPHELNPCVRTHFLKQQSQVLTKMQDLENGERGEHINFAEGDVLPFESIAILGKGGYGVVDKVISLLSFKEYARKRIFRGTDFIRTFENAKNFQDELRILKHLKHRHIVQLVGSYTDPQFYGLIMSPVAPLNLAEYFSLASSSNERKSILRTFFGCLSTTLQYLHDSKIRHKDVKPQ